MAEKSQYGLRPLDTSTGTLSINLVDKENKNEVVDTWTGNLAAIAPELRAQIFAEGVSRILQQRHSQVDMLEKFAAFDQTMAEWAAGQYLSDRKAGSPTVKIEIVAFAELKGLSVRDAQKFLSSKCDAAMRDKIYASEKVQAKVAEIKARETVTDVDLSDII